MPICCAALMCHAPIVVPEVGGAEGAQCRRTTQAMASVAHRVVAHRPDRLALISPHAPRDLSRWGLVGDEPIVGSFARFGRGDVVVQLPGARAASAHLAERAAMRGVDCVVIPGDDLDHGSVVPLYFLERAGWAGSTLVIALPYADTGSEEAMGEALREAADTAGERWAIVASGDMSHRLTPGAPAGYHPRASAFDAAFVDAIEAGSYRAACRPEPALQDLAAEDVVASTRVATAATGFASDRHRVLSYEGPFGVGYLEAILYSDGGGDSADSGAG